ncbi:phytoene desaturase family protein [Nocardioides aequoreus]|uniref:phytoene desaturase family protein n=1 Tax=Nocardioides aequoreus TaxID=397278 RepID=UPI0004C43FE3|nr:NAD(P)/FAD-dependent oxidoreductase [Nocardioides aequoreus]
MTGAYDAVVVGAGPNGLVAANLMADAGRSVLVLEEQPTPGGAVRSDSELHPDFVHDTFSAFYPLGAASPVLRDLGLEQHGLTWAHAPAVLGHALPDGGWALLHRDPERTAAGLEGHHAGDGDAWLALTRQWDRVGPALLDALLAPFPPVRRGAAALRDLARTPALAPDLLRPATGLVRRRFGSQAARLLLSGNAGHADLPVDALGSGAFALLMTMTGQRVGFPVPTGGAQALTDALVRRLLAAGGELRCGVRVDRVLTDGRGACGVRAGREVVAADQVLADVLAPALYEELLDPAVVPRRVRLGLRRFELDPGTVKVDWALDGTVPWEVPPEVAPGCLHLGDPAGSGQGDLVLAGQMTTTDPRRSPAGTEAMWAYTHVPQGWGGDPREVADDVQARLERLAPGFGARVLARRVLGPADLEARDRNLRGGSIGGGTARLRQQLVLRPVPGLGRAESGVPGLYLASSSAHPGGGVHGAPGANAARAALWHARR